MYIPLQHRVWYVIGREYLHLPAQQLRGGVNAPKELLTLLFRQDFWVCFNTEHWHIIHVRQSSVYILPATPVCFTSSTFDIAQKHVPYTIGPGNNVCVKCCAARFRNNQAPSTGPLPASSMPMQHSSVLDHSGTELWALQLWLVSDRNASRSSFRGCGSASSSSAILANPREVKGQNFKSARFVGAKRSSKFMHVRAVRNTVQWLLAWEDGWREGFRRRV